MTRTLRTLVATASVCILGSGCGSDTSMAPVTMASVAGTYNLTTYHGLALPALVQAANPKVEVLNDQVIVSANGSWSASGTFRITDASGIRTQIETGSGTYTLTGSTAMFREATDGDVRTVVFSSNIFTVTEGTQTVVYTR
jgi:hypothetical protein